MTDLKATFDRMQQGRQQDKQPQYQSVELKGAIGQENLFRLATINQMIENRYIPILTRITQPRSGGKFAGRYNTDEERLAAEALSLAKQLHRQIEALINSSAGVNLELINNQIGRLNEAITALENFSNEDQRFGKKLDETEGKVGAQLESLDRIEKLISKSQQKTGMERMNDSVRGALGEQAGGSAMTALYSTVAIASMLSPVGLAAAPIALGAGAYQWWKKNRREAAQRKLSKEFGTPSGMGGAESSVDNDATAKGDKKGKASASSMPDLRNLTDATAKGTADGMTTFFDGKAYSAKWTKEVVDLLKELAKREPTEKSGTKNEGGGGLITSAMSMLGGIGRMFKKLGNLLKPLASLKNLAGIAVLVGLVEKFYEGWKSVQDRKELTTTQKAGAATAGGLSLGADVLMMGADLIDPNIRKEMEATGTLDKGKSFAETTANNWADIEIANTEDSSVLDQVVRAAKEKDPQNPQKYVAAWLRENRVLRGMAWDKKGGRDTTDMWAKYSKSHPEVSGWNVMPNVGDESRTASLKAAEESKKQVAEVSFLRNQFIMPPSTSVTPNGFIETTGGSSVPPGMLFSKMEDLTKAIKELPASMPSPIIQTPTPSFPQRGAETYGDGDTLLRSHVEGMRSGSF